MVATMVYIIQAVQRYSDDSIIQTLEMHKESREYFYFLL